MSNNRRSVGKYISILYRYAQSYITVHLKPLGIGSGQYMFLVALYKNDGFSQVQLSQSLMIDKATTARAIRKLEEAGYVTRQENTVDRRAYGVFLTQKAKDIEHTLFQTLSSMTDIFVADLSEPEKQQLFVVLEKMINSIKSHMQTKDLSVNGDNHAKHKYDAN
jgi:DNA-binding MarR family transcriptional regulator